MKITITIPWIFSHIKPFCLLYFANTLWYRAALLSLSLASFIPQTTGAGMMRFLHVLRKHFRKKGFWRRSGDELRTRKNSNMSEWNSWHTNKMTNEAFRLILFLKRYPELRDRYTRRDRCINLNWICFTTQMVADIITWFMLPFETSFSCNVTLSLLSFMFAGWRCEPCLFCFEQELI